MIGARHDFHNPRYCQDWADRFVPTPEREELFSTIISRLNAARLAHPHVLELGIGPGYLAEQILAFVPDVSYEGVDFSAPMLAIASNRLSSYATRVDLTRADLLNDSWCQSVRRPIGAIVSTWALHDLGGEREISNVYRAARSLLCQNGLFLNGDFVKPDATRFEFEPGRLTMAQHLSLLADAGFQQPSCLVILEQDAKHPTSANNYVCFQAFV